MIVQQLVSSIPQSVLIKTSYGCKQRVTNTTRKTVTFVANLQPSEYVWSVESGKETLSGESDNEQDDRKYEQ